MACVKLVFSLTVFTTTFEYPFPSHSLTPALPIEVTIIDFSDDVVVVVSFFISSVNAPNVMIIL